MGFRFKKEGTYSIVMRNMEADHIIANVVMEFEECHDVKIDLDKDSLDQTIARVDALIWRLFKMFGINEVAESSLEHGFHEMIISSET